MNLNALVERWSKSASMPRAPRSDGERFGFFAGGPFRWIPFTVLALGSHIVLGGSLAGVFGSALIVAADVALPAAAMTTVSVVGRSLAAAIRERKWATFPKAAAALSKCFMADLIGITVMFAHAAVFIHAKIAEIRHVKAVRAPGGKSQKTLTKLTGRHARAQLRKAKFNDFGGSVIHARQDLADTASAILGEREAWRRARMWILAGQPERAMKIFQARPFDPRWPCPLPRLDEEDDPGVGRRALVDRLLFRKPHQLSFADALRVSGLHPEAVPMAFDPDRLRVFLDFVASMAATVEAIELKKMVASDSQGRRRARPASGESDSAHSATRSRSAMAASATRRPSASARPQTSQSARSGLPAASGSEKAPLPESAAAEALADTSKPIRPVGARRL